MKHIQTMAKPLFEIVAPIFHKKVEKHLSRNIINQILDNVVRIEENQDRRPVFFQIRVYISQDLALKYDQEDGEIYHGQV